MEQSSKCVRQDTSGSSGERIALCKACSCSGASPFLSAYPHYALLRVSCLQIQACQLDSKTNTLVLLLLPMDKWKVNVSTM